MISKAEAIGRLKKMGVTVADDQSIVTILLPSDIPFQTGIKDIKEKLKAMDYDASFSIRRIRTNEEEKQNEKKYVLEEQETEPGVDEEPEVNVTEEELQGSLLSMDDDGQFSLGGFGLDF